LRATTITDSDRREWIIPNKKFITDDVMNWTLTDTISRAVFAISVPHGSDTRRVQQILLDVAKRQSVVMDYPEPSAVLVKIGTRSLDYELRVFLASRSGYSILQNQLHMELIDALGEAGIDVTISMGDNPLGSQPAAGTVVSLTSAVNPSGAGSPSKKAA
jgi:potassium efflux system protein